MKELSVFVDESGDFGEFDPRTPYYIIALVFHDQSVKINDDLIKLEYEMKNIGWPDHCVHSGPIIRAENEYKAYPLKERQRIIRRLMTFTRKVDIRIKIVYVEKKKDMDEIGMVACLSRQLADTIRDNAELFGKYHSVKVYYDNGQIEVTKILISVFGSLLDNVEFKKVIPSDYRLFQVADLVCTIKLIELKCDKNGMSNSERYFFNDVRTFKKNYIKPLSLKSL